MQFRSIVQVIVTAALILMAAGVVWAGAHEDYLRGMNGFKGLLADEKKAALRSEWQVVLASFEKSLAASPKGEDAPKCMYFIGRVHEELGRRSFLKSDRENALSAFDRMIAAYPKHGWTDDSLYRQGVIWKDQGKDQVKARALFERIIAQYPEGDMAGDARQALAGLGDTPTASAAPTPRGGNAASVRSGQADQKKLAAKLMGIRHWSSQKYTRVVLDLDRDAVFERALVEQEGGKRQLVLTLPSAGVASDVIPSRTVKDGILSHIRAEMVASGGARVTLDLQQMDHFRAFTLPDPYRIVVDVFGPEPGAVASSGSKPEEAKSAAGTSGSPVDAALQDLQRKQTSASSSTQTPPAGKKNKAEEPPSAPATQKGTTAQETTPTPPQMTLNSKQKKLAGSLVEQLGLKVRTVMIDPGHGGKDPGAIANGVREKDINLRMAKILGRMLQDQGFDVLYTRTSDVFISLEERTARANAKDADLFVSVHCNAYSDSSIRGLEIYYLNLATDAQAVRVAARENGVSAKKISDMQFILSDLMLNSKINESKDMASLMQKETVRGMQARFALRNLGSKGAFFYVLTGARMPSVLVELGYLTNPTEAGNLTSDAYLTAMAKGMVGGVVAYKKKLERYASAGGGKS